VTGRQRRACWRTAVSIAAAGLIVVASACSSPPSHPARTDAIVLPDTPAGRQASWLAGAVHQLPVPAAAIRAHFDQAFLAGMPAPAAAALNGSWAGLRSLRLDAITASTPQTIVFTITVNDQARESVTVTVDARGLISLLHLQPAGASPTATPTPTPAGSAAAGVRQIAVGVGSPPLKGTLTLPAGAGPFPAVVLVSGSGPNNQDESDGPNHPFLDIALGLAARGIASIRYDKRTLDYPVSINQETFTLTQEYVPDALAAIRLLDQQPAIDPHRIFVLGHSQGGTYAPLIAREAPQVAGVVMLAAAAEPLATALLRQVRYLATLPGTIGANAEAELPSITQEAAEVASPAALRNDPPDKVLLGGAGPAYFLSGFAYNEVATARSIPQPLLFLQGDRDYQVTVANDLDMWLRGLQGRAGVTVVQFPDADHLFLDGSGPATPLDYQKPGHVDPAVIATIASWIGRVDS
jgi:pimeloyl-ACP methyl ester carboxylesterase